MQEGKWRYRNPLLAAAVTSVGLAAFGSSPAQAGLMLDLRAVSVSGTGGTINPGGKVVIAPAYGRTVTIGVYARVSGTNTDQTIYDVNGDGSQLVTTNDEALTTLVGAFSSVGSLLGNMGAVTSPGPNTQYNPTFIPFGTSGFTNGVFQDFDSDGDLDLGTTGTDPTNMWAARANAPVTAAVADDGSRGFYIGGVYITQAQDTLIDPTTMELRIGTLRFIPTAGNGSAQINFIIRSNGEAAALWFEDGIATGKNPTNSPFSDGAPVVVSVGPIPEPTAASLLGLASLGLLSRRYARTRSDRRLHGH